MLLISVFVFTKSFGGYCHYFIQMKFLKFTFLFLLFTVLNVSTNVVSAQSVSDLDGYSWKPKAEAVTVLSDVQRSGFSDVAHPENLVPSKAILFDQLLCQTVEAKIAADIPVVNAIIDGYAAALSVSNSDPAYAEVGDDEKLVAFNKVVELLKQ